MKNLVAGDLTIAVFEASGVIRLDWQGKSNLARPEIPLLPFLSEVTRAAASSSAAVHMHFEELEFFNSSTITTLIKYVKDMRERKLRLEYFYRPGRKWQKAFFDALWVFEKGDGLFKRHQVG